eukprot:1152351-Pelagomonas_calceolata.AAC.3
MIALEVHRGQTCTAVEGRFCTCAQLSGAQKELKGMMKNSSDRLGLTAAQKEMKAMMKNNKELDLNYIDKMQDKMYDMMVSKRLVFVQDAVQYNTAVVRLCKMGAAGSSTRCTQSNSIPEGSSCMCLHTIAWETLLIGNPRIAAELCPLDERWVERNTPASTASSLGIDYLGEGPLGSTGDCFCLHFGEEDRCMFNNTMLRSYNVLGGLHECDCCYCCLRPYQSQKTED